MIIVLEDESGCSAVKYENIERRKVNNHHHHHHSIKHTLSGRTNTANKAKRHLKQRLKHTIHYSIITRFHFYEALRSYVA